MFEDIVKQEDELDKWAETAYQLVIDDIQQKKEDIKRAFISKAMDWRANINPNAEKFKIKYILDVDAEEHT
jgi:hypothetical protein